MSDEKIQWTLDLIQKLQDANIGKPQILLNIKSSLEKGEEISEGYKKYLKDRFDELHGQDTSSFVEESAEEKNKETVKTEPSRPVIEPKTPVKPKSNSEFCRNCGNEISEKLSNFCSKCGTARENVSESFCENCGQKLFGNTPCPNCTNQNSRSASMQRPPEWKSEGTTLVLSIVLGLLGLQGIGHIYVGQVGKGIGILIVSLILFAVGLASISVGIGAIFLIIYIIMFFWQIFNSRTLCREYNDYLEKHGGKPW